MIPQPTWLPDEPPGKQAVRWRFYLRYCALMASEAGTMDGLGDLLGLRGVYLSGFCAKGGPVLKGELAVKIELALGREVIRREDFRPDLYIVAETAQK